jgi:hypothetical protein
VREKVVEEFNNKIVSPHFKSKVWNGCSSWYSFLFLQCCFVVVVVVVVVVIVIVIVVIVVFRCLYSRLLFFYFLLFLIS